MVDRSELIPGTIALTSDGRIAIITEIKPNNTKYPVLFSYKLDTRGYKGSENDFMAVLGIADLDVWNERKPARNPKSAGTDSEFLVPSVLKGIKIGDRIEIRSSRGTEVVTYDGYKSSRPKYPVSFTDSRGRSMKGPLTIVVGKVS